MKNLMDFHTHTLASGHAYSTLNENIISAKAAGLKVLGVSDHAPNMPGGAPIFYFHNLKVIPNEVNGIRILKGAEVNIIDGQGRLDLDERSLDRLDYAIVSLHLPCYDNLGAEGNTDAIIGAMGHPKIVIIGHPDDDCVPVNYERLVLAAKANHVLLEMNNSSLASNSARENAAANYMKMLAICKENEVPIMIGSDAHYNIDVGRCERACRVIERAEFPLELVANFNLELAKTYMGDL